MNWRQKLDVVREVTRKNPKFRNTCDVHDGASEEFISSIKSQYPFVDDEYLDFLRYTDGCRIYTKFILGSGSPHFIPDHLLEIDKENKDFFQCPAIADEIASLKGNLGEWRDVNKLGDFMPVATSILRDEYCLMLASGKILWMDCEERNTSFDRILGRSFEEFLNEYMMGPKYPMFICDHVDEWEPDMEDDWTEFLHEQGWWVL